MIPRPTPDYVPAHGLLAGRRIVITAAAGAGIGSATALRCLEEGAALVVIGDTHPARLQAAHEELAGKFGADRVRSAVCDVTNEDRYRRCSTSPKPRGRSTS